jgi:hypothetical protein
MRFLSTYCIIAIFLISACEEPALVFPDEVVLSCQEDVDMIAPLLIQGVFDELDPGAGFRGNVTIKSGGSCGTPITDLSFFSAYRFWLGSLTINSNDIDNLDFLSTIEQFRSGLSIVGCSNLRSISLPQCAEIEDFLDVIDNTLLEEIQIGQDHNEEIYDEIFIDSLELLYNPILESWRPGLTRVNFGRAARIVENPFLTDLTALSNLSMPRNIMDIQLYGSTINETGENMDPDSLLMPARTFIDAIRPDNDYSWLSKAKITPRIDDEGLDIGTIADFRITGSVTIPELCPLASIADTTGLEVISTLNGMMTTITAEMLEVECPE